MEASLRSRLLLAGFLVNDSHRKIRKEDKLEPSYTARAQHPPWLACDPVLSVGP